jgi:hypothetical protein
LGFGRDNFGSGPFGDTPWAKKTLWDLLPQIYKSVDDQNGNYLQALVSGLGITVDQFRRKIRDFSNILDPMTTVVASDPSSAVITLGNIIKPKNPSQQTGVAASYNFTQGIFYAPTGRFSDNDIGKVIDITPSDRAYERIRGTYSIARVIDANDVHLTPALPIDCPSILKWSLSVPYTSLQATTSVEVVGGDVSNILGGWSLFDSRGHYKITGKDRFSVTSDYSNVIDSDASDGMIVLVGNQTYLASRTRTFTNEDLGKPVSMVAAECIVTPGSPPYVSQTTEASQGVWTLGLLAPDNIVPEYSCITIQGKSLLPNQGPFYFSVLHKPRIILEGQNTILGAVENSGQDMTTTANLNDNYNMISASANFTYYDLGKIVRYWVSGSGNSSPSEAILTGIGTDGISYKLAPCSSYFPLSTSNISWELRSQSIPYAHGLGLQSSSTTVTVNTSHTVGGVLTDNTFTGFTSSDVGNVLRYFGTTAEPFVDCKITAVPSEGSLHATVNHAPSPSLSNVPWQLIKESDTGISTGAAVKVSPQSLLEFMAESLGNNIIQEETESRQRSWVKHLTDWYGIKGSSKAYTAIGAMSGYEITGVNQLYALNTAQSATARLLLSLDSDPYYDVSIPWSDSGISVAQETKSGRSGTHGSVSIVNGYVTFSDTSANPSKFYEDDIGRWVRIRNGSGDTRYFTIQNVNIPTGQASGNSVIFKDIDSGVSNYAPQTAAEWNVARPYTIRHPQLPIGDDINIDRMQEAVGPAAFHVDMFAWELGFRSDVFINVIGVSRTAPGIYEVTATDYTNGSDVWSVGEGPFIVSVRQNGSSSVVVATNNWTLTGSDGELTCYLTQVPRLVSTSPNTYKFQVSSNISPVVENSVENLLGTTLGPYLKYNCPITTECGYCPSNNIIMYYTPSTESPPNISVIKLMERLEAVTPIHVNITALLA